MEYYKIISVTGFGGLFELVGNKSDGAIVRSLEDKTTKFVSSRVHNFSHLESIEIFTEADNVNLIEILQAMEKSDEKLPDEKDAAAIKSYFEKVYPQIDFTRVYASDTKKMVRWFKILKENKIELKLREPEAEPEVEEVDEVKLEEKKDETKPAKETTQKTKTKEKREENKVVEAEPEIKKAKKAAPKKSKDETAEEEKPKKKTAKKKAE